MWVMSRENCSHFLITAQASRSWQWQHSHGCCAGPSLVGICVGKFLRRHIMALLQASNHGDLLATVVDGMEGGAGASIWRVAAHPCAHMVSPWDMSATSTSNFTDLVLQILIHPAMVNVWWWCQFMVWCCCSPATAALLPPWQKASYGLLSSSAGATHTPSAEAPWLWSVPVVQSRMILLFLRWKDHKV